MKEEVLSLLEDLENSLRGIKRSFEQEGRLGGLIIQLNYFSDAVKEIIKELKVIKKEYDRGY